MAESVLQQVCIWDNYVRSTFYSDVFRAKIHIGNQYKVVDIEHIRLPVNDARTYELRKYYGLNQDQIDEYNTNLAACVRQSLTAQTIATNNALAATTDRDAREKQAAAVGIKYIHQEATQDNDGTVHVYFVTDPAESALRDPSRFTIDETNPSTCRATLRQLAFFMYAVLMHLNKMHGIQMVSGVICADTIVAPVKDQTNRDVENDALDIKIGLIFAMAQSKREKTPFIALPVMPFNTCPTLLEGKPAGEPTEIYSWATLFLSFLNGSFGTESPSTDRPNLPWLPPRMKDYVDLLESVIEKNGAGFKKADVKKPLFNMIKDGDLDIPQKITIHCKNKSYFSEQDVDEAHEAVPILEDDDDVPILELTEDDLLEIEEVLAEDEGDDEAEPLDDLEELDFI